VSDDAPKAWRGRLYEDFSVGDVSRRMLDRTITDANHVCSACVTPTTR